MTQHTGDTRPPSVLTIAGSDSGGGAGIQADLKTFAAFGVHGLSAIAALTAQNTRGVTAVHVPPVAFLREQIDVLFADFRIESVKLGMLANAEVIEVVADALAAHAPAHVVIDPVMVSTSGARLLDEDALDALHGRLFPLATLLTPNLHEAELLLGERIPDGEAMAAAARNLHEQSGAAVLMKGGHLPGTEVIDMLFDGEQHIRFCHPRLDVNGHGTGCTLSAAIAAKFAQGWDLEAACRDAADYVFGALRHALRPGTGGVAVLDHGWRLAESLRPG
ncbi:bifunctional hydroxymethylpyrimidine kinase/phosphomethylpyrimidine kinase [Xanthomonadaceae bacterium JHOS43]|nr:bifunctional hydroxymethylpyrimidine kinase/phosphomethylpyrimidine kinase [Xanthomonadaceae bacterium JHOS43]